jgi:hypothetical protein
MEASGKKSLSEPQPRADATAPSCRHYRGPRSGPRLWPWREVGNSAGLAHYPGSMGAPGFSADLYRGGGSRPSRAAITIVAGALFGSVLGVILVNIVATVGASLAFVIARYFARDAVVNWLSKSDKFQKLDHLTKNMAPSS